MAQATRAAAQLTRAQGHTVNTHHSAQVQKIRVRLGARLDLVMMPQMTNEQPEAFRRPPASQAGSLRNLSLYHAPRAIFLLCNEHRNEVLFTYPVGKFSTHVEQVDFLCLICYLCLKILS